MKQAFGFLFFMLFLAGFAFVMLGNLKSAESMRVQGAAAAEVTLISAAWSDDMEESATRQARSVRFQADGKLTGFAGCNNFFGSFVATDKTMQIGALGATRKACPQSIMQLETSFLQALESANAYHIDANVLTLADGKRTILQLILSPIQDDN